MPETPDLLTPQEVARIFGVNPRTVTAWARAGQLPFIQTLGGHRRYRRDAVLDLYERLKEYP